MRLTVLHTNDFHGTLTAEMAQHIAELKSSAEGPAVYFDCGDAVKSGNLAAPLKPEPVWPLLDAAGCDAGTIGNRESHPLELAFKKKLAGAGHPLLCANIHKKDGRHPLLETLVLIRQGVKIGLVGVMVPIVTPRMASRHASSYLWEEPISVAAHWGGRLRNEVDCLIALTHIGHRQDLKLAEACPEFDFILGGHSHTLVDPPVQVGQTFVCQGGSHGKFVGRYVWTGTGNLESAELIPLAGKR